MIGKAYVFCRFSGAMHLGHVAGAFQMQNGAFRCFGTENPTGRGWVAAKDKGFWYHDCHEAEVVPTFGRSRTILGIECGRYDVYKILTQNNPDYGKAMQTLAWCAQQDYQILSPAVVKSRTCEDDVCDTLSAYGLWMPWTITYPAPNAWFGVIAAVQHAV